MQVNLRKWNGNIIFNKLPVYDPADIRFHIFNTEDIIAEKQEFKIQLRITKIHKTGQDGFPVCNLGVFQGTFF